LIICRQRLVFSRRQQGRGGDRPGPFIAHDYPILIGATIAVDTQHHLIVAHEVTNVRSDRHQLASMAAQTRSEMGIDTGGAPIVAMCPAD
jgi:hypothetical protein